MKEYFLKYRPFLQFLGVFLASYLVLIVIYQSYLNQFDTQNFEVDGFTELVARQTKTVLNGFNYKVDLAPHVSDPSVVVRVESVGVVRIVEGCNAISVMILFVAFILAFSKGFLKTTGFILAGILIIHLLNILRIAFLTIGILKYPEYKHILHGVIFPLIIYGTVFLLWIIWVTKFANNEAKIAKT
ncbi:exosortase family protein XrtF [Flavobacterium antarcticum]|uniref:exosortase family protein XrtF n=1 Tax=Flavobacterium antarcticum TaxID=271155 RepID=UPI0003B5C52F|nr:exosortase family protein XrtF [Flavobacterium antarcticum]